MQSDRAPVNKTESTRCYENWGIHEMIYCMKIIAVLLDSTLAMLGPSGKLHIVSWQCFRRGTCKRSRTLLRVASTVHCTILTIAILVTAICINLFSFKLNMLPFGHLLSVPGGNILCEH